MDSQKPRFSVSVDADLYEKINTYQHENRMKSQTQAIAAILKIGIQAIQEEWNGPGNEGDAPAQVPEISPQLARIIDVYNSMNAEGQTELAKYARLLSLDGEYKKGAVDVSEKAIG